MNHPRSTNAVLLATCAALTAVADSETIYFKEMPKPGEIAYRKIVYVDDGECPKGEVKEVTGGSMTKFQPRQVRCVKPTRKYAREVAEATPAQPAPRPNQSGAAVQQRIQQDRPERRGADATQRGSRPSPIGSVRFGSI